MFPNGSGGTGRFVQADGVLSLSREAEQISSRSANLLTRRAGNGISVLSVTWESKGAAMGFLR